MTVVAMCAVVTVAAMGDKKGVFDTVTARTIFVKNDAGQILVSLSANDGGDGLVSTCSAKGKELVSLNSTVEGHGTVTTFGLNGKELIRDESTKRIMLIKPITNGFVTPVTDYRRTLS